MAFTAIARQNSSDGNCDESLLTTPSEENLKNVLTTLTVTSVLISTLYTRISHNLSEGYKKIEWDGYMGVLGLTGKSGGPTIGGIIAYLSAERKNGETVSGTYLLLLGGLATSSGWSGCKFTVETPGLFGYDPKILIGSAVYIAGSVTEKGKPIGPGVGISWLQMGMGWGAGLSIPIIGNDTGVDMFVGISSKFRSY